jgi:hypothetical protein
LKKRERKFKRKTGRDRLLFRVSRELILKELNEPICLTVRTSTITKPVILGSYQQAGRRLWLHGYGDVAKQLARSSNGATSTLELESDLIRIKIRGLIGAPVPVYSLNNDHDHPSKTRLRDYLRPDEINSRPAQDYRERVDLVCVNEDPWILCLDDDWDYLTIRKNFEIRSEWFSEFESKEIKNLRAVFCHVLLDLDEQLLLRHPRLSARSRQAFYLSWQVDQLLYVFGRKLKGSITAARQLCNIPESLPASAAAALIEASIVDAIAFVKKYTRSITRRAVEDAQQIESATACSAAPMADQTAMSPRSENAGALDEPQHVAEAQARVAEPSLVSSRAAHQPIVTPEPARETIPAPLASAPHPNATARERMTQAPAATNSNELQESQGFDSRKSLEDRLAGKDVVSKKTAAEIIGVKSRQLRNLVKDGKLAKTQAGKITSKSIREYMSLQEIRQ